MNKITYQQIDPTVLASMTGDIVTFNTLSQTFLDQAPTMWQNLEAAIAQRDFAKIRHVSHSLKSMTALVGAGELTLGLQRLETNSRKHLDLEASDLKSLFDVVIVEVALSITDPSIFK